MLRTGLMRADDRTPRIIPEAGGIVNPPDLSSPTPMTSDEPERSAWGYTWVDPWEEIA